jgi:hypothetical protein
VADLGLDQDDKGSQDETVPAEIQKLLRSYSDIFAAKVCFPPPRVHNHSIP